MVTGSAEEGEAHVRAKFAEMPAGERALAERIHALVTAAAPELVPRTWYGMPAYTREGKVVCFFQAESSQVRVPLLHLRLSGCCRPR